MKSTEYTYGISPHTFSHMRYDDALHTKLFAAKKLRKNLNATIGRKTFDESYGERTRLHMVEKAIKLTTRLLDELQEASS